MPAGATLTLPALRSGPLPLPRCGRGAVVACSSTSRLLEFVVDRRAVRPDRRNDRVAVEHADALVGEEDVGARLLHQVLHVLVHDVALGGIELDQRLLVQLAEFGAVPT